MSEFIDPSGPNYFRDNAIVLNMVNASLREIAQRPSAISLARDPATGATVSEGFPSAADYVLDDPDLDAETAEEFSRIQGSALQARALTDIIFLTTLSRMERVASLYIDWTADGTEPSEELRTLQSNEAAREPLSFAWRQYSTSDESGCSVVVTSVGIRDENDVEYASKTDVEINDGLLQKKVAITELDGKISQAISAVSPVKDKLVERVVETVGNEGLGELMLVMSGVDTIDSDAALNETWLKYQGTSKEHEIGPLLDEVRDRGVAAHDSRLMRQSLGENGEPSFQELAELNAYLATL